MSTPNVITLDVRPDFRAGQSPCDKIQNALASVGRNETLRLLVPFEPIPLYAVAATRGLSHQATQSPEGHWEVSFNHDSAPTTTAAAPGVASGCGCSMGEPKEVLDVDARGLEPPQPMVRILETLASLPVNAELRAKTDRRPVHLYPMLQVRGFTAQSEEQSDGSFITHIRRL